MPKLTAGPALEPVTRPMLKLLARVDADIDEDDALIDLLISAARGKAEEYTGRAFISQQWRQVFDVLPGYIELPRPPLLSVETIKYTDEAGTETTVSSSLYHVLTDGTRGAVLLKEGYTWPTEVRARQGYAINYTAGYGTDPASVPFPIRSAIALLTYHLYEHGLESGLPASVLQTLHDFRVMKL